MKHTLLALAFAAAALTGCSSTKPAPVVTVQDGKAVVAPAKADSCKKGSCSKKACKK